MTDAPISSGARFHERLAAGWDRGYERGGFRRRLAFVEAKLRPVVKPGAHWLDLGCGAGTLTRVLADLGAQGEGVDGSPAMIEAARASAGAQGFTFRQIATVEQLDAPDASFDGVLCSSVIEYLEHPGAALDEIARVLRPWGHLLLSVAHRASALRRVQGVARTVARPLGRDLYPYLTVSRTTYARAEIQHELTRRGLLVDTIDDFDPVLPGWSARLLPPALIFVLATKRNL